MTRLNTFSKTVPQCMLEDGRRGGGQKKNRLTIVKDWWSCAGPAPYLQTDMIAGLVSGPVNPGAPP